MRNTDYVRGTLTPTKGIVDTWTPPAIQSSLNKAGLGQLRLDDLTETDNIVRGIVDFRNLHASAGPGFLQDFSHRLQMFISDGRIERFGLEGEILVISDSQKEFPEISTVLVQHGVVTYRKASLTWGDTKQL